VENPNSKVEIPMYNFEEGTSFPTYSVLPIQNIHLRCGKVLQKNSLVIIEEQEERTPEKISTENVQKDNQT
jgi:hypothetical protein